MGKTEKGALWLDAEKTSPYEFFQYWRNVADEDVIRCMKLITFIPIEEIEAMEHLSGSELNAAKERLAFEVTKMVHGEEEAQKCLETARSLFGANRTTDDMPSSEISSDLVHDGAIGVLDLLVATGLCPSKGEGRRLVQQGGITIDDNKIANPTDTISVDDFSKGYVVIRKGKKVYHKAILN